VGTDNRGAIGAEIKRPKGSRGKGMSRGVQFPAD